MAATQTAERARGVMVTYVPREEGDKHSTVWNGVSFKANIPTEMFPIAQFPNSKHFVVIDAPHKIDQPDGSTITVYRQTRQCMVELAKLNPHFEVAGFEKPEEEKRKPGRPRIPKNANEYRSYAMGWITSSNDVQTLLKRWDDEDELREKIGCGEDDTNYLVPFFDARVHILKGQQE